MSILAIFFFQAESGIRDLYVTGVQTCALTILAALDLGAADRQRLVRRLDGAELTGRLGGPQQVEVDLDVEDLLHATDVGVAEQIGRASCREREQNDEGALS